MRNTITQATVFWFDERGTVSLEQPSTKVRAIAFRLEQLRQLRKWSEGICLMAGYYDRYEGYSDGVRIHIDEAGRIVVSRFWGHCSLRQMKIRVVASSEAFLAEQFGCRYDPHYYDF